MYKLLGGIKIKKTCFGSAFIGRGFHTASYFSKSVNNYTSQAGLYGYGGQSVIEGTTTTYQSKEYSYFDRGTLTGNYWSGSDIDRNNLTAQLGGGFTKPAYPNSNPYLRRNYMNDLTRRPEDFVYNINQFSDKYNGYNLSQLLSEYKGKGSNSFSGTNYRYLNDPLYNGVVIDMKHFLNSIIYPQEFGNAKEILQKIKANIFNHGNSSTAYNPQDYYSNNLGNQFIEFYNNNCDTRCNATYMFTDPSITFMIREFLTIKGFRNGR